MIRAHRRAGDSGSAVVEAVLVVPAFMVVVLVVVQFALWAHASHVVQAAAARGESVAQQYGGDPSAGSGAARTFLDQVGGGLVGGVDITSSVLGGDQAVVSVTGSVESIVPMFHIPVSATVIGPIQEFRVSG